MNRLTILSLATAAAACACACSSMSSPQGVLPVGPAAGDQTLSSFYAWQGAMPRTPGTMLRAEDLPLQPQLSAAASAWRILYTTTDARWRSGILPASGTLH